jgi:hypothetical protein
MSERKEILTSRPDGMTFDEYKILQRAQGKELRKILVKAPMYKTRRPRIKSKK